jgi:hypothetical protein
MLAVAALAPATASAADPVTERASAGNVEAEFQYTRLPDRYGQPRFRLDRLEVRRNGQPATVLSPVNMGQYCRAPFCAPARESLLTDIRPRGSLTVRDVNADGEPEVILDTWSSGAHCCTVMLLLYWDGSQYRRIIRNWWDGGYRLAQLDKDGEVEFLSVDNRFRYKFAPYVYSGMPVQIWALRGGKLVDATTEHPDQIRKDRARWLKSWMQGLRDPMNATASSRGFAAAWAADAYRISGRQETLKKLRRAADRLDFGEKREGRRFVQQLDRFLVKAGYKKL